MGESLKRESRSTTLLSRIHDRMKSFLSMIFISSAIAFALTAVVLSSGCNNLSQMNRAIASLDNNLGDSSDTSGSGAFVLDTVLPSQHAVGALYDLLGVDNQFDQFCPTIASCKCQYVFTQPNVGAQTVIADVTYTESNMVRVQTQFPVGLPSLMCRSLRRT